MSSPRPFRRSQLIGGLIVLASGTVTALVGAFRMDAAVILPGLAFVFLGGYIAGGAIR